MSTSPRRDAVLPGAADESSAAAMPAPGLYTRFVSSVLFPLHEWSKGHDTVQVRRELERTQWLGRAALEALQLERLRALLRHAAAHVPFYRDLFAKSGFDPARIDSLAALADLPVLTKDAIRGAGDRLKADGATGLKLFSTTGSTGDPLRFFIGKARVTHDVAAKWRATRWWGVDIGDPEVVAWSSPIELHAQDRLRRLRDRLFRTRLVPSIALTLEKLDACIAEIRAFRPRMLYGYPSSLALIAQRAAERGVRLDDLGAQVVFATAERTYPHQRAWISKAFGCPVADGYGGRDAGFLAHECPAGGLHVTAEDVILEVVDEAGRPAPPGVAGDVVVTHLFSHDFPFIRYRNGDVATLDAAPCSCGRGLPLVKEVLGRTNDFLLARNGARVHDVAFAMVLRDMPGVNQFKIIQESETRVRLQLVAGPDYRAEAAQPKIDRTFHHFLGADVAVEVEYVARIEPERSGKYRYVVNQLNRT